MVSGQIAEYINRDNVYISCIYIEREIKREMVYDIGRKDLIVAFVTPNLQSLVMDCRIVWLQHLKVTHAVLTLTFYKTHL